MPGLGVTIFGLQRHSADHHATAAPTIMGDAPIKKTIIWDNVPNQGGGTKKFQLQTLN